MHYILFGVAGLTLAAAELLWRAKLEPLRLYRGESGVRPDRYGQFLSSEWYQPKAAPWLKIVGTLWVVAILVFLVGIVAMVSGVTRA